MDPNKSYVLLTTANIASAKVDSLLSSHCWRCVCEVPWERSGSDAGL